MKQLLAESLPCLTTVDEVETHLLGMLATFADKGTGIALVSGAVFADGLEHVARNLTTINNHTQAVRQTFPGVVLSCPEVIYNLGLDRTLDVYSWPYDQRRERFIQFWQNVVSGGVTDLFMVPGWERSEGARDEYATATRLGLQIHHLPQEPIC
jgi:hypothetical protein